MNIEQCYKVNLAISQLPGTPVERLSDVWVTTNFQQICFLA